ncbi:MAG: hypothetical protein Q8Q09_22060 [Deltaproteobacteria bacterium]|nr:hypothetical protein [Deltaproteobacteria bacterium]
MSRTPTAKLQLDSIDGGALGALLLKPPRRALKPLWDLLRECDSYDEQRERLVSQDVVPSQWLEDPPSFCDELGRDQASPTPTECLAIAADSQGIVAATELARAMIQALSRWQLCAHDAQVRWCFVPRARWRPRTLHPMIMHHARFTMPRANLYDRVRLSFLERARSCAGAREIADTVRFAALWRATAHGIDPLYSGALAPPSMRDRPPHEWPDPWEPLLGLLSLGYAPHEYTPTRWILVGPLPEEQTFTG